MTTLTSKATDLVRKLYASSGQARWAMGSQVVTSGANFATTLIIVRSLGVAEFGRFSVCFLLIMITRNFLNGLVLTPMSTIAPKLSSVSIAAYRGFLAVNGLVFSLGASVLLFAGAIPLGALLNAPWLPQVALALALANLTANSADFMRRYQFVYEASGWAFFIDVVRFAVQLGLLLLLATVWHEMFSTETALYALTLGGLSGALVGLLRYGAVRWSIRFSRSVWPRHWNFIKWMTPNVALETVQSNGVLLIGGALLGEAALGGVRAMLSLANMINLPANALQQIAPSLASAAYVRGGYKEMQRFLIRMMFSSLLAVICITLVVFILADLLIGTLFHISVAENLPVLLLFCVVNALIVLRLPLMIGLQSLEQPNILTLASLVGASTGLVGVLILADVINAMSIPAARVLVLMVTTAILGTGFWNVTKQRVPAKRVPSNASKRT